MKKLIFIFVLMIIAINTHIASGQKIKSQSDEEKFIEAVHFLEKNPLDKKSKDLLAWALNWSYNTKKVNTVVCDGIFGLFLAKEVKGELLSQYLIMMTAFKLENPEKAKDEEATQLAAMESALKVYEAFIQNNPNNKLKTFDSLLLIRDKGNLPNFIKSLECTK